MIDLDQNEIKKLIKKVKKLEVKLKRSEDNRELLQGMKDKDQLLLQMMRLEVSEANEAKSRFFANMSHEIRTPMNAVLGFLEIVLDSHELSDKIRKHVTTAHRSAKGLLSIINDILDFSKLDAGKMTVETIPFNLHDVCQEAVKMLEIKANGKGLDLVFDYPDNVPKYFQGDPTKLRQVFINLLGNAIKFTESGHVDLSVSKGKDVVISIKDSGIGMSEEQVSKIFESFTQADDNTTRKFGGTGLGTTISKEIITLMNGDIVVESEPGKGSTFHIHVPLVEASESEVAEVASQDNVVLTDKKLHILVAEDIDENAELLKIKLTNLGHSMTWAKDGKFAIEAFAKEIFDVVLMDVQMPRLNGIDATIQIRAYEKENKLTETPIIALTASILKEDRVKCINAGMNDVASKPIDFNQLFKTISVYLPEVSSSIQTNSNKVHLDLSIIVTDVNLDKAIDMWGDAVTYAKSLIGFMNKFEVQVLELGELNINDENEQNRAYKILHALKGVSGNLCIIDLTKHLVVGNEVVKKVENSAFVKVYNDIRKSFFEMKDKVNQIQLPINKKTKQDFDLVEVLNLLHKLNDTFDDMDPDVSMKIIDKLNVYFDNQLSPIVNALDDFEFDEATEKTTELIKKVKEEN